MTIDSRDNKPEIRAGDMIIFLPSTKRNDMAQLKRDMLFAQFKEHARTTPAVGNPSLCDRLMFWTGPIILQMKNDPALQTADVRPADWQVRPRSLHAHGSVAAVTITTATAKFPAVLRLSSGTGDYVNKILPGAALKVFRNNAPEGNVLCMPPSIFSVGWPAFKPNLFDTSEYSTDLQEPTGIAFRAFFKMTFGRVTKHACRLCCTDFLSTFGIHDPRGTKIVSLIPTKEAVNIFDRENQATNADFRGVLTRLPAGLHLFTIQVKDIDPRGEQQELGKIFLDEPFVSGGDDFFFFPHHFLD